MSEPRRIVEASPDSEAAELLRSLDTTPPPHAGARVWRRLSERERPRPWARRAAVGLSALAAGLGLVYLGTSRPDAPARVLASRGAVELSRAADRDGGLSTGTRIKVGPSSSLRMSVGGAAAELLALSEATLVAIEQVPALELTAGTVEVAVPKDEAMMMVIAGRARVELPRGAGARIERGEDEALAIAVHRGPVTISDGGRQIVLQAGEARSFGGRVAVAAPQPVAAEAAPLPEAAVAETAERVVPAEEAARAPTSAETAAGEGRAASRRRSSGRAQSGARAESAASVAEVPPSRPSSNAKASAASAPALAQPSGASAPALEPKPASAPALEPKPASAPAPATAVASAPTAAVARAPTPDIPQATPAIPPVEIPRPATAPKEAPRPSPSFDEAAVYRRARSSPTVAEALRLYDEVRDHRGALAEVAAHQAANLLLRSERYAEAAARLEAVLSLFPGGVLSEDGRLSLIECRIRQSDLTRAKQDLDRFLSDYPGSERSPDLRFVRAELARRSERCEAAIPDYRAAATGRNADDAAYFLAWCAMQSSEGEGRAALDAYLSQFPRGKHAAQARARLSKKE